MTTVDKVAQVATDLRFRGRRGPFPDDLVGPGLMHPDWFAVDVYDRRTGHAVACYGPSAVMAFVEAFDFIRRLDGQVVA